MNPKQNAREIFDTIYAAIPEYPDDYHGSAVDVAKCCATICVNEILKTLAACQRNDEQDYWEEVKQEIQTL